MQAVIDVAEFRVFVGASSWEFRPVSTWSDDRKSPAFDLHKLGLWEGTQTWSDAAHGLIKLLEADNPDARRDEPEVAALYEDFCIWRFTK